MRGAGKTALLRILGGLEAMESGVIRMGGAEAPPEMRARAAAVMGADVLLFEASVRFNVALGLRVTDHALAAALDASGLLLHDWAREHIEGNDGDWTSLLDMHVASPGAAVRQCLGLARTILLQRPMVLLDEPTSCQPPHVVRHQAKALRNGACRWQPPGVSDTMPATVVISTRSPMVVAEMELAFVLSHGLLVEHGPPRLLLKRSSHLAQVRFRFPTIAADGACDDGASDGACDGRGEPGLVVPRRQRHCRHRPKFLRRHRPQPHRVVGAGGVRDGFGRPTGSPRFGLGLAPRARGNPKSYVRVRAGRTFREVALFLGTVYWRGIGPTLGWW